MIHTFSECWVFSTLPKPHTTQCPRDTFINRGFRRPKFSKSSLLISKIQTHSLQQETKILRSSKQCWNAQDEDDSEISKLLMNDEYEKMGIIDSSEGEEEWGSDQLDAIASLFRGTTPTKSRSQMKERCSPVPMNHKIRPLDVPQPKRAFRSPNPSKHLYKNPEFLINLARQIRDLPPEEEVSKVLDKWLGVLQKGSLSLTIRELGHMCLPQRALQTFCWVQKCPKLYPDQRVLDSTLEILARAGELKTPFGLRSSLGWCNRSALEAIARGFIKAGKCQEARQVLLAARDSCFQLDDGIHAKLIVQAAKSRRWHNLAGKLIDELGARDNLNLEIQDCTAVMKGCIKLGMCEAVESLFLWWKESGNQPNVVMYTTLVHSRYCGGKFREAFALVWEMEESNCLLDLPAYRVIIRLCAELDDLTRAARYFSKMKDAGFVPTHDIYSHLIKLYSKSGRLAKCKELLKQMEMLGLKPNPATLQCEVGSLPKTDCSLSPEETEDSISEL